MELASKSVGGVALRGSLGVERDGSVRSCNEGLGFKARQKHEKTP